MCELCELANFNSAATLVLSFQLRFQFTASQFRACDFFILCLCSNTSKEGHFYFSDPKGQKIAMVVWITCTTTLQNFFNAASSPKHPCSSSCLLITECIVIIIQPQIQLHTPLHVTILRDHVILFGNRLLRRYY